MRYGVIAASLSPRFFAPLSYCVRQICRTSLAGLLGKQINRRSKPNRAGRRALYKVPSFHFRSIFNLIACCAKFANRAPNKPRRAQIYLKSRIFKFELRQAKPEKPHLNLSKCSRVEISHSPNATQRAKKSNLDLKRARAWLSAFKSLFKPRHALL